MFKRIVLFQLSILILSSISILAQHGPVTLQDVGNIEDYSNPQVIDMYQDSRGLLWISTFGGMDRWDGNQMISFPYIPFDSTGSPARLVRNFTADDQNNLWLSGDGLIRFDLAKEVYEHIPLSYDGRDLNIQYLKYDQEGFLWVGCREGVYQFHPATEIIRRFPLLEADGQEISNLKPSNILPDSSGKIWMAVRNQGLSYFDPKRKAFVLYPLDLPDFVDKHMNLSSMEMDGQGNLWLFGSKAELAKFNPYSEEFEWAGLPVYSDYGPTTGGDLVIDRQGRIWFGVDQGLRLYDPITKTFTHKGPQNMGPVITKMISDKQGNILVSTLQGVRLIDNHDANIRTVSLTQKLHRVGPSWVTSVAREKENLWVGTFRTGICKYNLETGQLVTYQADGKPGSIKSNYICKVLRDRNGRIWFTSQWDGTLYRVNEDNNSFKHFQVGTSHLITQCEEGFFWILGLDRIVRFDPLTLDTMNILFTDPLPFENLYTQLDFTPFIRDKEGIFWFAQNDQGLIRIDPETRDWTHYNYDKNNPDGLPDPHIKSLFCDSKGQIWLSTWVGISKLISNPDNPLDITFDNHFITDRITKHTSRITEDKHGNIYVGTLTGLIVIRTDGTTATYTHHDGLIKAPPIIWALDSDHENGNIYLGGSDVVIIPQDFLSPDTSTAPILLTEFRIGGETIHPGESSPLQSSILVADRIDLDHDQNFFRIDFTATHLSHSERNRFRYYLEGIDMDTVYSGTQNYAEYTDLSPGNYTFWVSGASHRGSWHPEGRSIEIRIHPPWYKSGLAYGIYVFLFIILILGYIRIRTSRLQKEKIHLEAEVERRTEEIRQKNHQILELDSLKTRFFNNISHEFRTLVTMVKAPAETLMEEEKVSHKGQRSLEVVYRNANRLMKLVTQLLDISRVDKGSMKLILSKENIFDIAHSVAVSFSSLAEVKGIHYPYYLPRTDSLEWIDADKLEKILNNLLSNAFKFTGEGGKVRLDMVQRNHSNGMENVLEISVSDTGIGIQDEEQEKIFDRFYQAETSLKKEGGGTGIGLALTRDLVELMHGTIKLKSQVGKGSTFTVLIPLGLDHLAEHEYTLTETRREEIKAQADITLNEDFSHPGATTSDEEEKKTEKPLLLVVEDNADILWLISDKMRAEFDVLEAVDGSAGLKLATEQMPDLVITDLMMPRMDGFELCKKLKTDVRTSHIPVIMLTAKAAMDDKMHGLETGADDYLTKPFEIKEVLVRSRNLVEQRRKLREKFCNEITLDPMDIVITSTDEKFLNRIMEVIDRHISNEDFDVSGLCEEMNMSRSTLFRKLDALTNQSPVEFIRTLRLKRAAVLLKEQYGNVSEVALEVGFSNPSYFAKMFKKAFSVSPSEFAKLQPT